MTVQPATDTKPAPLGWSDLGRYFIFYSAVTIIFTAIAGPALVVSFGSDSGPDWLGFAMWVPVILSLYLTMRPHGRLAWQQLGFKRTEYYWYITAISGWIGLVVLLGYGLPAIGEAIAPAGILSGSFPNGKAPADNGYYWLATPILTLKLASIIPMEIVFRGLALNALRNVWSARAALWTCALLTTSLVSYFIMGVGLIPAGALLFTGALFNGWLVVRSGSIWPGLLSMTGFISYFTFFLERTGS